MTKVKSTCPYCGVGCGVEVEKQGTRLRQLGGDAAHPANQGRLCVKGTKLLQTTSLDGRLLIPTTPKGPVSWEHATSEIAEKLQQTLAEHGPDSVAFYVSGQLLTEDYYVANKLMKGFIGSANIDTNSRLCMSSAVASYKRAFGEDLVPCCYEDLEKTDLVVFVGSNAAWTHPVLFQRIEQAKQANPNLKLINIDPRKTAMSALCDIHLSIKPGSDVALFNGLLSYLDKNDYVDKQYLAQHCNGAEETFATAKSMSLPDVAAYCDVTLKQLLSFYQCFAESKTTISFYSMGVNQSVQGADKGNAIINCHLATGKIGKEGSGPFSITGQPNAMGGREVGGLANMLAAHMDIENPTHRNRVQKFWKSPRIAHKSGLKAVDLFEKMEQGDIKFVWIMATNPVASMPNRNKIERALSRCDYVVVSDCVQRNDTLAFADLALPAAAWSEKDGTVTNSERCISRQKQMVPLPEQARYDWQIICDVAKEMGYKEHFAYTHPAQIFDEHARLTAFENNGDRALNLHALVGMSATQYSDFPPIQWPTNQFMPYGKQRLFSDNKFYTKNKRANLLPVVAKKPAQQTDKAYPFTLNSGRLRDHWHTMTRTGKAADLCQHVQHGFVAMHADDGVRLGVSDGEWLALKSKGNLDSSVILPVSFDSAQRLGELFTPIHFSQEYGSANKITALYTDAHDAISGQPELKHAAVKATPVNFEQYAQVCTKQLLPRNALKDIADYWVMTPLQNGFVYTLANRKARAYWLKNIQRVTRMNGVWMSFVGNNTSCAYSIEEQSLSIAVFCHDTPVKLAHDWLDNLLMSASVTPELQYQLLRLTKLAVARGAKSQRICSCFKVHESAIVDAIKQGTRSVKSLGLALQCGTNCGSCKPELYQLIAEHSQSIPIAMVE